MDHLCNMKLLQPHTMSSRRNHFKIDVMKPTLHEETFIRSVEYIATIMPKSSSSTSFPHFHCMSRLMQWAPICSLYSDDLIICSSPLKALKLWWCWARLVSQTLLSQGRLQLFLIFLRHGFQKQTRFANTRWRSSDVLVARCSTGIVVHC